MAPLRILFLTLEFSAATFSGNGIYAQSQVRALSKLGNPVFVISGRPKDHDPESRDMQGATDLVQVPVSSWGHLDASAPHEEFALLGSSDDILQAVASFRPDVAMVVDWSALGLYNSLDAKLQNRDSSVCSNPSTSFAVPPHGGSLTAAPKSVVLPMVYLNYRVFSRTATAADLVLVSSLERQAQQQSMLTVALSRSDAKFLTERVATAGCSGDVGVTAGQHLGVQVLLPALREDMRAMDPALPTITDEPALITPSSTASTAAAATEARAFVESRPYLTCCVRLSPEKEPHRFVELVEELARRPGGITHVTPLLVGASNNEYAAGLKARLRAAAPNAVVLEQFMGPSDLAKVFRSTRLNVHPATYDAFGMTIVEAASQGAPSVVHGGAGMANLSGNGCGAVGAADLLLASENEVLLVDFASEVTELADAVQTLLLDSERLLNVAMHAAHKARSWSEEANALKLIAMVEEKNLAAAACNGSGGTYKI